MMPVTDRRGYPRRDTRAAVIRAWMFDVRGRQERCRVVEVSRKGVLIKSSQMLRVGAKVQIAFAYDRGSKVTRLFRRWTRIARHTPNGFAAVFVTEPLRATARRRAGDQ